MGTRKKKKKIVLITGISGYIGSALVRQLVHLDWCARVDGLDVVEPLDRHPNVHVEMMDLNAPDLPERIAARDPDVLVHLAFVLRPMHDLDGMRRVNVDGTHNVLQAAERAGVRQLVVASSGTAYGAYPDNPVPLAESAPLRPNPGFDYAVHKGEVERLCQTFAEAHPDVAVSLVRPCVVYGPRVRNYLSDLLTALPVVMGVKDVFTPVQFVHEDDVARALVRIIESGASGPFNVAPADSIPTREVVDRPRRRRLLISRRTFEAVVRATWALKLPTPGLPPSFLPYMYHPWVLDPSRLCDELGFTFHYSTRQTLDVMLRSKGIEVG